MSIDTITAYAEGLLSLKRGGAHSSDTMQECACLEVNEEQRKREKEEVAKRQLRLDQLGKIVPINLDSLSAMGTVFADIW